MARTLAELNADAASTDWIWSETYKLRTVYAVGASGRQNGWRGASGSHVHALRTMIVIEDLRPESERRANTYKTGDAFSVVGLCNGNGQQNGKVYQGKDLDAVTCSKCRKALGLDS